MPDGTTLDLPDAEDAAIYVVEGRAHVDGEDAPINALSVINTQRAKTITARGHTRLALIGGSPLGKRHMWWNFVSSRKDRIETAKQDWAEGRFDSVVDDVDEHIPLPSQ
jgi:redox-sensitive bicupin YhaK (pirin superfamily)